VGRSLRPDGCPKNLIIVVQRGYAKLSPVHDDDLTLFLLLGILVNGLKTLKFYFKLSSE